jgi:hypothetical protein
LDVRCRGHRDSLGVNTRVLVAASWVPHLPMRAAALWPLSSSLEHQARRVWFAIGRSTRARPSRSEPVTLASVLAPGVTPAPRVWVISGSRRSPSLASDTRPCPVIRRWWVARRSLLPRCARAGVFISSAGGALLRSG